VTDYRVTFRYEPTPPDLERFAGCTHYSHWWGSYVYEFLDAEGQHLYIGRSTHLLQRLEQHQKNAPWYPLVAHLVVNPVASFKVACRVERRKILEHQPLHNVPQGGASRRRWDAYRAAKEAR